MSRRKWSIYLIVFMFRVWCITMMPYFVNSTSIASKSVIRCFNTVNVRVKVNLGQSSCYFDLRSNFQFNLSRSKSICLDASSREKHDGSLTILPPFSVRKLFAKNGTSSNCYLFSLTWPGGVKIGQSSRSTLAPLDSQYPKESFGLCPTVPSQLGVKWHGGLHPPPTCAF